MADMAALSRRERIATAIASELERQHVNLDKDALVDAVEAALQPEAPAEEGRHPNELNATNDD